MLTLSCKHVFKLYTRNMASESFLAVATVTNVEQSSADYTVNAVNAVNADAPFVQQTVANSNEKKLYSPSELSVSEMYSVSYSSYSSPTLLAFKVSTKINIYLRPVRGLKTLIL